MKTSICICILVLAILAPACSSRKTPQEKGAPASKPEAALRGNSIKFVKHEIMDKEGTGLPAASFLIPADWSAQDRLYWEYRDVFTPTRYEGKFRSPDSKLRVESFADVASVWMRNPMGVQGIRPPGSVIAGLKEFIRRVRNVRNLRYTDSKLVPVTQKSLNQYGMSSQTKYETGTVKVEYEENGEQREEEFYAGLTLVRTTSQGVVYLETIGWSMNGIGSWSAPKGRLEESKKIALTMRSSTRLTLPFYNRFMQVTKLLQDQAYARIYQAGQISRIISRTNDEISKSISDSYWERQKSNDHINQQFSDYIRGIDRYSDGSGTEWELPSGYSNAWVNNKGEYLLTDQTGFDPNVAFQEDWKELEKKP